MGLSMDLTSGKIIENWRQLKGSRGNFDHLYQTLHNYFYVEADNVTDKKTPGTEAHHLLDSTSLDAANVLAAGLANYLTPESSKWLFLEHANPTLRQNKEVRDWMEAATEEVLFVLGRSNFYNQMPIFYKASGVYGTSVLFCEADEKDAVRFYNIPVANMYMTEDARERPHEFYLCFEYTAEQAVSRFGNRCCARVREAYAAGRREEKFKYICYFGERLERDDAKDDKLNMPVRSVWVEEETKQTMLEDGYMMMPCVAHRFYKRPQTAYGYSPAMNALPYVRMVNTIADTMLRSAMKQTDPAIALPDDAFLGTPNFNPRAINYYQRGSMSMKDMIVPIGNFGNPNISVEYLEFYQTQIRKLMFYDTFQAFSELTKQMTVPEVMERISEKMVLLGPAVGRFMNDVLQPLIERVVVLLYDNGRLPMVPDVMREDSNFEVKFVGRLVQAQRQSEVNNIVNAFGIAGQIAQLQPDVLDKINGDKAVEEIFEITGVSSKLLNSDEYVQNVRQARAEAQAQEQQMINQQAGANIYKTAMEGARNEQQADRPDR